MIKASLIVSALCLTAAASSHADDKPIALPEISIFGESTKTSPLEFVPTVSEISGRKLDNKKQTSLGETLGNELGVSSTFFGPNASRPVIRGQDGDRVSILSNGTGILDASAASQDHGVAIEPMAIDRVEIVRGPSALLYGSNAVGGVVNVITNRIPEKVDPGLGGKFDTRYSSVDSGGVGALGLDYGVGSWAFHFDGSSRSASDYKIPGYARTAEKRANDPLEAGETEGNGKVPNSGDRTYSGALGASYIGKDGSFGGASYSHYDSDYGTVAEQNVKIKMKQDRVDAAFGLKNVGMFDSIRFKNTYSDYKHDEIDAGTVGTTFTNRGDEARVELKHKKIGDFDGLFGVQGQVFDFEALGDERFIPKTNNQNYSVFLFEEAVYGRFKPSFGFRADASSVKADETLVNVTPGTYGPTAEGAGETKSFTTGSVSLGGMYALDDVNSLVLNLSYNERAPNYEELFANGPHMATAQYEVGDANLGKEKSESAELSYRYKSVLTKASVGVYVQEFQDFIALSPQAGKGLNPDSGLYDLDLYLYQAVPARFYGTEAEVTHQFTNLIPGGTFELGLKFDTVTAKNRNTDQSLPRIPPMRETLSASYKTDAYTADFEVQHAEQQTQTAPNETTTDGYTLVNIGVEAPIRWDVATLSLYGRVTNLFDEEARSHVSVLKDIAPLPGRNVILGMQAMF